MLTCGRLSFLPITCPYCRTDFCELHFLPEQHACKAPGATNTVLSDVELAKRYARCSSGSGPTASGRLPCQKRGCKKFSLELEPDKESSSSSTSVRVVDGSGSNQSVGRTFTHAAPRCERCRGLFCMMHRSTIAHGCKAPAPQTEGQARIKAAEERKKKAAEVLAKHFPDRKK